MSLLYLLLNISYNSININNINGIKLQLLYLPAAHITVHYVYDYVFVLANTVETIKINSSNSYMIGDLTYEDIELLGLHTQESFFTSLDTYKEFWCLRFRS